MKHPRNVSLNPETQVLTAKSFPSLEELICAVYEGQNVPISDSDVWNHLHTLTIALSDNSRSEWAVE